jgi:enoyl-CoA hydratase/carnithine racemase
MTEEIAARAWQVPIEGEPTTIACSLDADGILTIELHRPERLNAFTVRMADELEVAFRQASSDDAVRAVVVTGSGRAFCAGMDLQGDGNANVFGLDESLKPTMDDLDRRLDDPDIARGVRDTGGRVVLAIFDCLKPVIAAVNGPAVGVGATLTLPMDVRIAGERSRFGFVFGNVGIVPDACSSWFLPRIVGLSKALQWSMSGTILDAETALRSGLVDRVVADDRLREEARQCALSLSRDRSAVSVALTRQMIWRNSAADHPLQAHKVESLALWHASQQDGKEGVRAFLEKRTPQFTSKASEMPDFFPWW